MSVTKQLQNKPDGLLLLLLLFIRVYYFHLLHVQKQTNNNKQTSLERNTNRDFYRMLILCCQATIFFKGKGFTSYPE
jgi:hypothetical protein